MAKKSDKPMAHGKPSAKEIKRFKAFMLLQERWVLLTLDALLSGPLGFNELSRRANCVINNTTLSQRLDLLEDNGIVERTVHSTIPPRTSYELTAKGRALKPVLEAIYTWAEKYETADGLPPESHLRAGHTTTAKRTDPSKEK
jgi:DNA-binding HxlR family transcriptional regulator